MNRFSIVCAALFGVAGLLTGPVSAQETKQEAKPVSGQAMVAPVTQQQLNAADTNEKTTLPNSAMDGNADRRIFKLLIDAGADPASRQHDAHPALF